MELHDRRHIFRQFKMVMGHQEWAEHHGGGFEAQVNWLPVLSGHSNDPDLYWWFTLGSGGPFVRNYLSHIDPVH